MHVAIGAVETGSIAQGVVAADAMAKTAEIEVVEATMLSPGKFWVLIGGGVAEVRAAMQRGREAAADTLLDALMIPQVHEQVLKALRGTVPHGGADDALGVIETLTASAAIVGADHAAKAARVVLRDIRLANGIGGKGVVFLSGEIGEVQAAIDAGRDDARRRGLLARTVVIPRIDAQVRARIR